MAKTRDQINPQYLWKLEDIFESLEAWDSELEAVSGEILRTGEFKGRLSDYNVVQRMLNLRSALSLRLERLFVYARMNRDTDNADSRFIARVDKITALMVKAGEVSSYIIPELSALPEKTLLDWAKRTETADYDRFFRELVRQKAHILSDPEERIMALLGEVEQSYDNIFTMLADVDMTFEPIKKGNEKLEMSHGLFGVYLRSDNRLVRKGAYESMYKAHKKQLNTLSALYGSSVKMDIFLARARKFQSSREAALYDGNIPVRVYDSLVKAVRAGHKTMHRYIRLRKKLLGVKKLKMYDMYVPLVKTAEQKYTYEQACELTLEALAPLGKEYCAILQEGFQNNWLDVYETKGKTSGAYSWGAYGTHPYMLLNFQDRLDDVYTLVHEAGHSMHTYLSDRALPYTKAQYRIFVAEVASTVNEVLLHHHLLNKTEDPQMRKYLLNHYLEQFRTTMFRQTMFAEFEMLAHEQAEKGESLTAEWMCQTYANLNRAYYGKTVDVDEFISLEWSRIPHFYRAFYVYQYATGFSAAVAIAQNILKEGAPAVEKYLQFLSSGGSDDPIELLKIAGLDLSRPDAVKACVAEFTRTLAEFTALTNG